ncbi:MAG: hypothetical protein ACKVZJ_13005 [Phycisphaerales bacterium]
MPDHTPRPSRHAPSSPRGTFSEPPAASDSARSTALYDAPVVKPPEPDTLRKTCPDCGGNILAIASTHCPHCNVNIISAIRRHESNAGNAAYHVDTARRALVPMLIAYAVLLLVLLLMGDPASESSIGDLQWFGLRQAFFVPIAVALYWVLCAAWLGFDQPFHVSIMGIMTAVAVSDTVGFFMWWLPVMFAYQFVVALALTAVIRKTLELEYQEALIVGFILGAVRYASHVVLSQWVGGTGSF